MRAIYKTDPDLQAEELRLEGKYAGYASKEKGDKEDEKVKDAKGTFRRFIGLLKPHAFPVAVVLLMSILSTIVSVVTPEFLADIIDSLEVEVEQFARNGTMIHFGGFFEPNTIFNQLFKLGALYFATGLFSFVQQFVGAGVSQKLVFGLRRDVNRKLSKLPLSYFDKYTKGEIISKLVNDIDNVSGSLQSSFISVVTAAIQVVGALFMMIRSGNVLMMLAAIILVPFSGSLAYRVSRISKKWFKRYWRSMGALNGHVEEMYTGHNIVRIFNHEETSIHEFKVINNRLRRNAFAANMIAGILRPTLTMFSNINYMSICVIGGCYYIGRWFNTGKVIPDSKILGLGQIQAFLSYSSMFTQPITNISAMLNSIQSSLASAERVFALLDEEEQLPDDTTNEPTELARGEINFEDVSFRYLPDVPLIENFNLRAQPGQTIAIVGPTGAGKTTIVNLLMRFYEVNSGRITLDGVDITTMSRNALRENIGMVLQDTWLFKGTIRENLLYGRDNATEEEMIEAAKSANAHDFIMNMPAGYDTKLTEDGTNLSQGQRQLLTIARALLKDPRVLILDEATSSVDTRTEILIQRAMNRLMKGRTSFVIAHRLSTIKNADRIIVMAKGSIVEIGNHHELMEKNGFYAALYNSQYTGGIPEDALDFVNEEEE